MDKPSGHITTLAKLIADDLNASGILPEGTVAEYLAFFKRNVEDVDGISVSVCPHSQTEKFAARNYKQVFFKVDVAIQYKLQTETYEDGAARLGVLADKIFAWFQERDVAFFKGLPPEYYPYHGDSLESNRVFTSIVQTTFTYVYRL